MDSNRRRAPSFAKEGEVKPTSIVVTGLTVTENASGEKITTVVAHPFGSKTAPVEISYSDTKIVGNGSFGVVFQIKLQHTGERAAVKRVLQDHRFKNRELDIMLTLQHPNVVDLKYFYYTNGSKKDETFLNLVLEYLPETLYQVIRQRTKSATVLPMMHTKLFLYQLMRGIAYIHSQGVCHRDIKPQNLLVDPASGLLKICDFGSAKMLVSGEPNVAYICSRFYRAPELIFGATKYTTKIDVWSVGCVFGELLLGRPLFPGESAVDQLVEIVKTLGSPSAQDITDMQPDSVPRQFPKYAARKWTDVFKRAPSDAVDLISKMLLYSPKSRPELFDCLAHPFFDELRAEGASYEGLPLPPLFNFTAQEMALRPVLMDSLIPRHMQS